MTASTWAPHAGLIVKELNQPLTKFLERATGAKSFENHPDLPVRDKYAKWVSRFTHLHGDNIVEMSVGISSLPSITSYSRVKADTLRSVSSRLWDNEDLANYSGFDLWTELVSIAMETMTPCALPSDDKTVFFTTEKYIVKIENLSRKVADHTLVVKQSTTSKLKPIPGQLLVRTPTIAELAGVDVRLVHQGSGAFGIIVDVGHVVDSGDQGGVVIGGMVIYDIPRGAIRVDIKDHGRYVFLKMDDIRAVFVNHEEM